MKEKIDYKLQELRDLSEETEMAIKATSDALCLSERNTRFPRLKGAKKRVYERMFLAVFEGVYVPDGGPYYYNDTKHYSFPEIYVFITEAMRYNGTMGLNSIYQNILVNCLPYKVDENYRKEVLDGITKKINKIANKKEEYLEKLNNENAYSSYALKMVTEVVQNKKPKSCFKPLSEEEYAKNFKEINEKVEKAKIEAKRKITPEDINEAFKILDL